jgi:hypothetical protein
MTRPRLRGFAVIDPGGNWIRTSAAPGSPEPARPTGRLGRAVDNAVVLADSHGDHHQAAKIPDAELGRPTADEDPVALIEAIAYRAEIALTLADPATATALPAPARGVTLSGSERKQAESALAAVAELEAAL